jgi:hypothetical protein
MSASMNVKVNFYICLTSRRGAAARKVPMPETLNVFVLTHKEQTQIGHDVFVNHRPESLDDEEV